MPLKTRIMDNNTPTTVSAAEQMARQLWPIPNDMSYADCEWMTNSRNKFIQGWEARNEEVKELIQALKTIAGWAGNQSDSALQSPTGSNDARYRGGMVVSMREIANHILNKYNKTT